MKNVSEHAAAPSLEKEHPVDPETETSEAIKAPLQPLGQHPETMVTGEEPERASERLHKEDELTGDEVTETSGTNGPQTEVGKDR